MLSLEETQKVLDLRERMMQNVRENKLPEEGISEEDLRIALAAVRSNRTQAAKIGEEKKVRAGKKAAKKATGISAFDDPKFAKFKNMNLD